MDQPALRPTMGRKYEAVARLLAGVGASSVLDVGCRDRVLHDALAAEGIAAGYGGVDLYQNDAGTVDFVCDVSHGLPVPDASYDAVAALDVLEHLDDLEGALTELVRVARRHVVVILPNLAHFHFRALFLARGWLSAKYDLTFGQGQDRHRWFTVVPQTDRFMAAYADAEGLGLTSLDLSAGRRTGVVERALRAVGFGRAWTAWAVLYLLDKGAPRPSEAGPGSR